MSEGVRDVLCLCVTVMTPTMALSPIAKGAKSKSSGVGDKLVMCPVEKV